MTIETIAFDPARYLDSEETIREYIRQVMIDGDTDEILQAFNDVARARGMAHIESDTGMSRESLYKAFAKGAKPRFDTVLRVSRALGVPLTV
ncbi:MAG TPA: putative addiction module antidote protein [Sutterella sp.]|nr:putative addiction module antidote protein [Sutterella sp.]